jgi:hypothetical protein
MSGKQGDRVRHVKNLNEESGIDSLDRWPGGNAEGNQTKT